MAFVDLTKQLAQQAIQSAMSDPAPPGPSPDNPGGVILNQIGAMQKALKEDEELIIHLQNGEDKIRVMEIFLPSPQVAVLTGIETRTSSPIRILRGGDGHSVNTRGLFPAGEGAGYAGGIMSAGVDGIRIAEAVASDLARVPLMERMTRGEGSSIYG